jgi:hypothetical protein
MTFMCEHCKSGDVERRGTREKDGEEYARLKCRACNRWSKALLTYDEVPAFKRTEDELAGMRDSDIFVVTCAQNNTPLDLKAWAGIKKYAKFRDAQILVVKLLYRNPTCPGELASKVAWWPPEVEPYLIEQQIQIAPGIRVVGDAGIGACAVNPLTGFETLTGADSAVFGHAQIQMKTVATPQNRLPKILQTTGSISQKNYSKSKSGKKGEEHHSLGFSVIEVDREEEIFHLRTVTGDKDSEFYDLNYHITSRGVKKINRVEAIILGDEHVDVLSQDVKRATFEGPDSIVQTLRPKYIVRHDVIDGGSISHHHQKSPSTRYEKYLEGKNCLFGELKRVAQHVEETTPDFSTSVIVPSNHHDHIKRWLEEVDWRTELWNAEIYHEMWAAWLKAIRTKQPFHPFTWWMQENCKADVIYLQEDYPFIVKDNYLGYHGHRGSDGARGNIQAFARIGAKTVTAHLHSPEIFKGATRVGTSSELRLDYTSGASSWMNTHCIIAPNGKRQLVHILWGDWRYNVSN